VSRTFPDARMTITQVLPYLWQGGMPLTGSDMTDFGPGVRVYVMRAEVSPDEARFLGAETVHVPLHDNANEPATDPPSIYGATWAQVEALAGEVAQRQREGKPTVVLCQWGYNRSGLLVGLAMAKLGYTADDTLRIMRDSRGPHPCGYGPALNNNNFRTYVQMACGKV